jgi:SAM-dependent methyltransferase
MAAGPPIRYPPTRDSRAPQGPYEAGTRLPACTTLPTVSASPGTGFDRAADRYDSDEVGNRVLSHMRERAFVHLGHAFGRGARLVELGSGTGTEASRLVREQNARIALVDPSPELLEMATRKVRAVHADALLGAHSISARHVAGLVTTYGARSFDGAYSSFGPLNCEPSLEPVAVGLSDLIRSGGQVVLSIINRWCPTETAWFFLHGQWREGARRWGGPVDAAAYPGGPKDVRTYYYSRDDIERAFSFAFRIEHVEALPLLMPPPYLDFLVARVPRLFRAIEPVEAWAATRPILRDLGDHVLVRMVRR